MRILAGDVGGTKTNLALVERRNGVTEVLQRSTYTSADHLGLAAVLADFCPDPGPVQAACFGVAGPVSEGKVELTNLDWRLCQQDLSEHLLAPVRLLNDLEANAHGIPELPSTQLASLQCPGDLPAGPAALISAGTGLGMALMPWLDGQHHPQASEAGHTDFSPRNTDEDRLRVFLAEQFGRASWEHVLSGPGLGNIYDWVIADQGHELHEEVKTARREGRDANAAVAALGTEARCEAAVIALGHFVSLYGAQAGNLALFTLPVGGLFLGGGIAPKLLEPLRTGDFLASFRAKAPFRELMASIPIRVILDPDCALWGAVRVASTLG